MTDSVLHGFWKLTAVGLCSVIRYVTVQLSLLIIVCITMSLALNHD